MNPTYSVTITPTRDLDVSDIIEADQCESPAECKEKMQALILSKHPSYWKRVHRLSAKHNNTTLTMDPREIRG